MAGYALTSFGGMRPRIGDQLLNPNSADFATNCLLLSGEVRGLHEPQDLIAFEDWEGKTIRWVFFVPDDEAGITGVYVPFIEERVEFLPGPLVNDQYDRYYYTRSGKPPRFSAHYPAGENADEPEPSDIINAPLQLGLKERVLGVPRPLAEPSLTHSGGDEEVVTRAYVWTVVNRFGEESAPSDPVVHDAADSYDNSTWTLTDMYLSEESDPAVDADIIAKYELVKKHVYRTVTGTSGTADYYYVGEADINDYSYADNTKSSEVSLNDPLNTYGWDLPPDELIGLTQHPNGFFIGFVGHELYFSEPYHPHAWPSQYVLSTEHKIVGVGVFGTSIAVITSGHPYICTGITPASLTLTKYQATEPCSHFRGIVPIMGGVLFPTFNGLKLMSATGVEEISKNYLTRDEWEQIDYNNLFATRYNTQFIGFYNNEEGFLFEPSDPVGGFSMLDEFWTVENVQTDPYSGEVWLIRDNKVQIWNPPDGAPLSHLWRSKEFVSPRPINLGCFQIGWGPADGSDLIPLNEVPHDVDLFLRVFADGVEVYNEEVTSLRTVRLPKGFKAIRWQFEFYGTSTIRHAKFAETGASLATI